MSKIIEVINTMIRNPLKLNNIDRKEGKFYFSYKGYMWSIIKSTNSERTNISLAFIIEDEEMIYNSDKFGYMAFNQLYNIILEKYYGIEKVFDDILKKDCGVRKIFG